MKIIFKSLLLSSIAFQSFASLNLVADNDQYLKVSKIHRKGHYKKLSLAIEELPINENVQTNKTFENIMKIFIKKGQTFNYSNLIKYSISYLDNDKAFCTYLEGNGIKDNQMIEYIRRDCYDLRLKSLK